MLAQSPLRRISISEKEIFRQKSDRVSLLHSWARCIAYQRLIKGSSQNALAGAVRDPEGAKLAIQVKGTAKSAATDVLTPDEGIGDRAAPLKEASRLLLAPGLAVLSRSNN
jgi:hypothetical protein